MCRESDDAATVLKNGRSHPQSVGSYRPGVIQRSALKFGATSNCIVGFGRWESLIGRLRHSDLVPVVLQNNSHQLAASPHSGFGKKLLKSGLDRAL